jgi:hypothetical protein
MGQLDTQYTPRERDAARQRLVPNRDRAELEIFLNTEPVPPPPPRRASSRPLDGTVCCGCGAGECKCVRTSGAMTARARIGDDRCGASSSLRCVASRTPQRTFHYPAALCHEHNAARAHNATVAGVGRVAPSVLLRHPHP